MITASKACSIFTLANVFCFKIGLKNCEPTLKPTWYVWFSQIWLANTMFTRSFFLDQSVFCSVVAPSHQALMFRCVQHCGKGEYLAQFNKLTVYWLMMHSTVAFFHYDSLLLAHSALYQKATPRRWTLYRSQRSSSICTLAPSKWNQILSAKLLTFVRMDGISLKVLTSFMICR